MAGSAILRALANARKAKKGPLAGSVEAAANEVKRLQKIARDNPTKENVQAAEAALREFNNLNAANKLGTPFSTGEKVAMGAVGAGVAGLSAAALANRKKK